MTLALRDTAYRIPAANACAEVCPWPSAICTGSIDTPGFVAVPDATVAMMPATCVPWPSVSTSALPPVTNVVANAVLRRP